ncbi:hypothetical protein [Streptomyces sp. 5-10]|uniref:hypothetical protein n=1 Tax=Streptomyces sp. 5-10 TaxID=878925 RepID=UPI00168B4398|nr:hypothetical protein [Streptomyces sp. 5-10]MBD3006482.1 hypothetical protein [Streptomyces sp. 5-10]
MTTDQTQLSLPACHTDEELLGSVLLCRLPEVKIDTAWKKLREDYRGITGSKASLPYSGLLTVLRAIGYTSATLYPTSKTHPPKFLATTQPINREDLHAAITLWEQALLQTPAGRGSPGEGRGFVAGCRAGGEPVQVSPGRRRTACPWCARAGERSAIRRARPASYR